MLTRAVKPRLLVSGVCLSFVLAAAFGRALAGDLPDDLLAPRAAPTPGDAVEPAQPSEGEAEGAAGEECPPPGRVMVTLGEHGLSLSCVNADAHEVFARIGLAAGLPVMVNDSVRDRVTAELHDMAPQDVIASLAATYGLSRTELNGITMISEGIPTGPASYLASEIATVPVEYVPANDVKGLMPMFLQNHIRPHIEQNAVVLSAPSDVIAKFREDIRQLDIPSKQIMIEILMVELTDASLDDLGVQLSYANGANGFSSDSTSGGFDYQGLAWLPTGFSASLEALASESHAVIRARPRVATVSGKRAEIFIGVQRFLDKTVRRLGGDGDSSQTSIDAGVRLVLRPYSGTGDVIIVDIDEAEISTLSAPDPVTGLPNRTSRTANTKVRVSDGQTIILGGLIQRELREEERGIPLLRDIPLIGKLFESTRSEEIETELVIFITPRSLSQTGHLPEDEEREIRTRFGMDDAAPAEDAR